MRSKSKVRGRLKIDIPLQSKMRPLFFTHRLNLFTADTAGSSYDIVKLGVAEDGRVELSFTFSFPYMVELIPNDTFTSMREFEHRLGHLLPPTYTYKPPGSSLGPLYLRVEYFLEAEICTKQDWSPDATLRQVFFIDFRNQLFRLWTQATFLTMYATKL
jgi:hypothetical protein